MNTSLVRTAAAALPLLLHFNANMSTYATGWHPGELAIQRKMGFEQPMRGVYTYVDDRMPDQHRLFYTELAYIAISTLDAQGRPWGSLLASHDGNAGFVKAPNNRVLNIAANVWEGDPIAENAKSAPHTDDREVLTAGLGIMFHNRRRNKFAGRISGWKHSEETLELSVDVDEALGNCPKYINIRKLIPHPTTSPRLISRNLDLPANARLPDEIISFIRSADTIFIATSYAASPAEAIQHSSHLGMNQRGGRPGFVRVRADGRTVVLPDYSGNRFMQSLGNIDHTPVAGLTIVDFLTGNILYLTGRATNLHGADAQRFMPQSRLLTAVEVTGYAFVADAFPVRQRAGSPVLRSPYSPPVRFLADEPEAAQTLYAGTTLALSKIRLYPSAPDVATFTLRADPPIAGGIAPGQAAIIDLASFVGTYAYQHMAPTGAETTLNDDGIRTWTVSSAHPPGKPVSAFEITVREKPGGAITSRLLGIARAVAQKRPELLEDATPLGLTGNLVGVAGAFVLPPEGEGEAKLLFVAGGIGITPFVSMLAALVARGKPANVVLVASTKEPALTRALVQAALGEGAGAESPVKLQLHLFNTGNVEASESADVTRGRITKEFLKTIDARGRDVYVCGPRVFENTVVDGLADAGIGASSVRRENFDY